MAVDGDLLVPGLLCVDAGGPEGGVEAAENRLERGIRDDVPLRAHDDDLVDGPLVEEAVGEDGVGGATRLGLPRQVTLGAQVEQRRDARERRDEHDEPREQGSPRVEGAGPGDGARRGHGPTLRATRARLQPGRP